MSRPQLATVEHVVLDDEPGPEVHSDVPDWALVELHRLVDDTDTQCPVPDCGVDIGWQTRDFNSGLDWCATVLVRIDGTTGHAVCLDCGYPPALDIPAPPS